MFTTISVFILSTALLASATPLSNSAAGPDSIRAITAMNINTSATFNATVRAWLDNGWCADDRLGGSCDEVQACANYLKNKGETWCEVGPPRSSRFCKANGIQIYGVTETGRNEKSYCRDVAAGLQWVIDNCRRASGRCAGKSMRHVQTRHYY